MSCASPSPSSSLALPLAAPLQSRPVRCFAVYGTLRDDDDSGAPWTKAFVDGVDFAAAGTVRGCKMFWAKTLNYPFVTLTRPYRRTTAAPPPLSSPSDDERVFVFLDDPRDVIHVRVLHWRDGDVFASKVARADAIEGFVAADESKSEYVRRIVHVDVDDQKAANVLGSASITAYMYVAAPASGIAHAVVIPHGDWIRRRAT